MQIPYSFSVIISAVDRVTPSTTINAPIFTINLAGDLKKPKAPFNKGTN